MLAKFLKFIVVVFVWIIIAAIVFGVAILLNYEPLSHAIYFYLGLIVTWYGSRCIWKLFLRMRARKRVEQLVSVESPKPEGKQFAIGIKWWKKTTEIENRFNRILRFIKASSLKDYGDPLHVLPWYLIVGDKNSRQKELLECLNVSKPTLDSDILKCEHGENSWHFFKDMIAIEVSEQARPSANQSAALEWIEQLLLLKKYRKQQPINGIVLCISLSDVMVEDNDEIMAKARKLRRLIEDSYQVLDVQVPVFLIITGLHKLAGFNDIVAALDTEQKQQILGSPDVVQGKESMLLDNVLARITEIVNQKTLYLLQQKTLNKDILKLPNALQNIKMNLELLMQHVFDTNLYEHTPLCRGLYFCSIESEGEHKETAFAKDLFSRLIPEFRHDVRAINEQVKPVMTKERKWVLGTSIFSIAAISLMLSLFKEHQQTINDSQTQYFQSYDNKKQISADINNLISYESVIDTLQERTWLPWKLSLSEPRFIKTMKDDIAIKTIDKTIKQIDELFIRSLNGLFFDKENMDDSINYIEILVRRINLLKAIDAGQSMENMLAMPMPYDNRSLGNVTSEKSRDFNRLYVRALIWYRESDFFNQEGQDSNLKRLQSNLHQMVAASNHSLDWMVEWVNKDKRIKNYAISEAWFQGGGRVHKDYIIPRAYTKAGKKKILAFVDEIKEALGASNASLKVKINRQVSDFFQRYSIDYMDKWRYYAMKVTEGKSSLRGREEWADVANDLSSGQNVYFQALNLVDEQLSVIDDKTVIPDWIALIRYYQEMRALGPDDGTDTGKRDKVLQKMLLKTIGKAGPVGKALAKQGKGAMKTQKKLAKASAGKSTVDLRTERLEQAGKLLQEYKLAISDFVNNSNVRSVSFNTTRMLFEKADDPGASDSSFGKAYAAVQSLQSLIGKPNKENQPFWQLFMGPIDFALDFILEESNCYLNDYWRNSFLADLESVPDYKKDDYLLGEAGSLWAVLDSELKPFLTTRLGAGYSPKKVNGKKLSLFRDFYEYVTRAREASNLAEEYRITIKALPTSVNSDAIHLVEQTDIQLSCADGTQVLENKNFPVVKEFKWSKSCTSTTLVFNFGHFKAMKTYPGKDGFYRFLYSARHGHLRLKPEDFTVLANELGEIGVKNIDIDLQVRGVNRFLNDYGKKPPSVPLHISACWG